MDVKTMLATATETDRVRMVTGLDAGNGRRIQPTRSWM